MTRCAASDKAKQELHQVVMGDIPLICQLRMYTLKSVSKILTVTAGTRRQGFVALVKGSGVFL